jgi:hypothetical protein
VLIEGEPRSSPASTARPADPELLRSRRRFTVACAGGIGVAMPVLAWMISLGTWNLLQNGFFTDFYDVQARALFHGHWNVPASVVQIEGFFVKGHTYIYFGPFPALIRMPILLFTSSLDGRLTQLSMLLAILVALVCTGRLGWKIRNLVSSAHVSLTEAVLVAGSIVVVGIGSVFVFLASEAIVYHEAEAWGAALAIAAFDALVGFVVRPSTRGLVITGALTTLDLLTRASVGLGPVFALGVLVILHGAVSLWRRGAFRHLPVAVTRHRSLFGSAHGPGTRDGVEPEDASRLAWIGIPDVTTAPTRSAALACVTVTALGIYAAVNYVKFGTLFSVPFTAQVAARHEVALRAALAANGGSLFGLKFVPTALVQYLRPDALRTNRLFPFVAFPPPATVVGHVRYVSRGWTSSVTSTMPAIVIAGAVGIWAVFRPARRARHGPRRVDGGLAVLRVPVVGAAVAVVGSLAYGFIVERYLADWMPLLVLLGLAGLGVVVQRSRSMARWARRTVIVVGCVLAIFGVLTNLALSILYQRELNQSTPIAARAQFVNLQERIDQGLFGGPPTRVTIAQRLPKIEPAGSLVILGNCAALYQSSGLGWDAVEQSAGGGHYRLRVTFGDFRGASDVYWPLVVAGERSAGDFVMVRPVGPDEVTFAYRLQSTLLTGPPVRAVPGRSYVIDVVVDADIGQVEVTMNGTVVLDEFWFVRPPVHATFGVDTLGGPTARTFDGKLERLSTPTPTCDAILRRVRSADR